MDTFCRFLGTDLYCVLTQIYESLVLASSKSNKRTEAKKVRENVGQERHFLMKDLDSKRVKQEKRVLVKQMEKNRVQEEKRFLVVRPSYTIRHNYPGPLRTYDGEERGEPRLIRLSDLNSSKAEMIWNICGDQDEWEQECDEKKEPECGVKQEPECGVKQKQDCGEKQEQDCESTEGETCDKEEFWASKKEEFETLIESLLAKRKASDSFSRICCEEPPTPKQLIQKEQRARTLYEKSTCQNPEAPPWDCLTYPQKLRFHWKAHMGWELQETPFDNFRLGYIKDRRRTCPKMGIRKIRSEMRLRWCSLDRSGRMPFIVQALLYQVAAGALDPADHCAVREFFQKVK